VINETKQSNNRKIKFYEHFSDFYRTKNDDMIYKIIQEPIGDGYCLIEEIENKEENKTEKIEQTQEVIKTSNDIIKEKDEEIEKLKQEIIELKKFYINT
jgi:peptidoglycan hydrolase CwlO-like protein